jgi:hypothetical protein
VLPRDRICAMALCSIDWEKTAGIVSALLVAVIGVITSYIAWQQYITNRRQLRLALFDRRLVLFNATVDFIQIIFRNARVDLEDIFKFDSETRDLEFLFGPEIAEYVKTVRTKAIDLLENDAPPTADEVRSRRDSLLWFTGQFDEAKKKFGKYMAFPEAL